MKKTILKSAMTVCVGMGLVAGYAVTASAITMTLDTGVPIMLIDAVEDTVYGQTENTTVTVSNWDINDGYFFEYNVNGGAWNDIANILPDGDEVSFDGGSVLDFRMVSLDRSSDWVLSNDADDDTFSVQMIFSEPIEAINSQNPVVANNYWDNLEIFWTLPSIPGQVGKTTSSLTIETGDYGDPQSKFDGFAPVPEPTTMLLFGTGLAGLAGVARRRRK